MLTAHSYSAAYVKAQQRQEPAPKPDMHASYSPHCLEVWAEVVSAVDETAGINDKEQVK
jgi:hypothetical protein